MKYSLNPGLDTMNWGYRRLFQTVSPSKSFFGVALGLYKVTQAKKKGSSRAAAAEPHTHFYTSIPHRPITG